jgi:RNA polymerase sigma-70 factor (ECF subfamily)
MEAAALRPLDPSPRSTASNAPVSAAADRPASRDLEVGFVEIYRAQFAYVWRALRRLGVREDDLADVTHDVFVVVHRKLGDYDASRPLKPWLFGICFRTALDRKRKASSFREALVDEIVAASPLPASDELVSAREAHDAVMRALDALDDDKRAVFVMHELEGLSMPEVAQLIDAPLNTLYSRLRLAREAFVAAVRKDAASSTRGGPKP